MLDRLPTEIQRKIVLMNNPSAILISSAVSRDIHAMRLTSLLLPGFLQDWCRSCEPGEHAVDRLHHMDFERRKQHNLCTRRHRKNLAGFYMKPEFVVHAEYIGQKLAELVGDRAKYDEPDHKFRFSKQAVNWKELGYVSGQHFEDSRPSRTERNMVCGFLQVRLPTWHLY